MSSDVDGDIHDVEIEDLPWPQLLSKLGVNKQAHEIKASDITGNAFPSLNAWTSFYFAYSRWKGFSVRHDKVRKDDNDVLCMHRWVCYRQGYRDKKWIDYPSRKRQPKPLTRIGYRACLTVCLGKDTNQWVATTFEPEHNHELASPSELHFLRSNRHVPDSMVAQAKTMRKAGIRTMSIIDFIAMQCGGRDQLPFLKKDLYNRLARERNEVGSEIDSEGALGYLTFLAIRYGNFYYRFNVDEEERLHTIFWADGTSRKDYQIFGDVLAFDTTHKTNAYNKPLLIMVGVNHHFRTTVYAVALLANETMSTYTWVLQQFLDCVDGKHSKTVVTYRDLAMHSAITTVFPYAIHRLCAWHLDTNAGSNIPTGEFKIQFNKLMYKFYSEVEFEEQWRKAVEDNNLQQNEWAISIYAK